MIRVFSRKKCELAKVETLCENILAFENSSGKRTKGLESGYFEGRSLLIEPLKHLLLKMCTLFKNKNILCFCKNYLF